MMLKILKSIILPISIAASILNCGGGGSGGPDKSAVVSSPLNLTYSSNPVTYFVATAISPNTPSNGGGVITSYSVNPPLPPGISLNSNSGLISGTPTIAAPTTSHVITGTNSGGNTSVTLSISVVQLVPLITSHPSNVSVSVGKIATFHSSATGTGALTYQWLKNNELISGANSPDYSTPLVSFSDNGCKFTVKISDTLGGSVTSNAATLTVIQNSFSLTQPMSITRHGHTATLLLNGNLLLIGGHNNFSHTETEEWFDYSKGSFIATGMLNTARKFHTASILPSGKVFIAGGQTNANMADYLSSAELYDPSTGIFTYLTPLGKARLGHTSVMIPNGKVFIAGGQGFGEYISTTEIYDSVLGIYLPSPNLTYGRVWQTATLLQNGQILIVGGVGTTGTIKFAELYNPTSNLFIATIQMNAARVGHSATLLPNGKVLIAGGNDDTKTLASSEIFDPISGTFTSTGSMLTSRTSHASTLLSNGKVLITGGLNFGMPVGDAELFDPATGIFTSLGLLNSARNGHTSALLPNNTVLLSGGRDSSGSDTSSSEVFQ